MVKTVRSDSRGLFCVSVYRIEPSQTKIKAKTLDRQGLNDLTKKISRVN